mgnify:FL=1
MSARRFTLPLAKGTAAVAIVAVAGWLAWLSYIYLASEAVIERRYTLPSSLVHASIDPGAAERGKHWMTLGGCFGCHGDDLKGRLLKIHPDFALWSPNLRASAMTFSDGDFERAIRHGLTPDARPMWLMPSGTYTYMRDKDLEDVLAYIRAQPPSSAQRPRPVFELQARKAIIAGRLVPTSPKADEIPGPADEGPRYDGGRYLSSISCAQCHGGDLTGSGPAPDLNVIAKYNRSQFFLLLYRGQSTHGQLPVMSPLAFKRFRNFHDYEVNAIYDYLVARRTLTPWTKEQRAQFDDNPAGKADKK